MMENILINSIKTSLIDSGVSSESLYQHKLISNSEEKIIIKIREELEKCDEFIISVAFITESGITMILEQLKFLEKFGIKGKILTGDYLNFTQPKALEKILEFKNIELKLLKSSNFHSKGYFFRRGKVWDIIIGSSNLTQSALTKNQEWNLKISALTDGKVVKEILSEFYRNFEKANSIDKKLLEEWKEFNFSREKESYQRDYFGNFIPITPNIMQKNALENLKNLRLTEKKALVISATGTGKTYLSAFDVREFNAKKVLFIAHRKNILVKSLETYRNVIRDKTMKIYDNYENSDCDYLFAMIQTFGKEEHFSKYKKDYFDYIIIDEVHHGGAKSYQKLLEYFTPKFLLGITATPERNDDFDIYKFFDYNIGYEIRLDDALREDLLSPFHYFGIADIVIEGKEINDKSDIKLLTSDERVKHILDKSKFYGWSGEKLHCLIFVSSVDEAILLEKKLKERGEKAKSLTGKDSDEIREKTIKDFEDGKLQYIISVDIFNEGVDIPCINQVIFLRPTNSPIIYIQQLGRGLRKYKDKEFLVVLDFIGNYEKNFLIPIAISQDSSYEKEFLKRFILNGTNYIYGESTISFDEIAKEKIFESINKSNFSTRKNIESDFYFLERQLGRTPLLYDFFDKNMIEPRVILKYKKTYNEILKILKPRENFGEISEIENNYLTFLSSIVIGAKRIYEIEIIKYLLKNERLEIEKLERELLKRYNLLFQRENIINGCKHLAKEIFVNLSTLREYLPIIRKEEEDYILEEEFKKSYFENAYFKMLIDDFFRYNLAYIEKNYKQTEGKTVVLHKEYSKIEAFWNLNLDFNNGYQVSGYTVFEQERKVVLFITLDEDKKFTRYANKFYSDRKLNWFSKEQRYLKRDGELTAEGKIAENYYTLEVFLKKKLTENFYYLGEVEKVLEYRELLSEKNQNMIEYILELKNPIEKELYKYFIL